MELISGKKASISKSQAIKDLQKINILPAGALGEDAVKKSWKRIVKPIVDKIAKEVHQSLTDSDISLPQSKLDISRKPNPQSTLDAQLARLKSKFTKKVK